jgi:hypothetical protein
VRSHHARRQGRRVLERKTAEGYGKAVDEAKRCQRVLVRKVLVERVKGDEEPRGERGAGERKASDLLQPQVSKSATLYAWCILVTLTCLQQH